MKTLVYLSFDFGVRGDYEGMYAFLDERQAKECGDGVGVFLFEYQTDLLGELVQQMKAAVTFDKRSRVYVVYPGADGNIEGRFVIGKRKPPVWAGFGSTQVDEVDTNA